jgi:acylphosphatase
MANAESEGCRIGAQAVERFRVTFTGRVQGVGFRSTARTIARAFAVTGWVRNEVDGSVTMEVQGRPTDISLVRARLRDRMEGNIETESEIPLALIPEEASFEISR